MSEMIFQIPESQLFRLIAVCANANYCTPNHKAHCTCRNLANKVDEVTEVVSEESGMGC